MKCIRFAFIFRCERITKRPMKNIAENKGLSVKVLRCNSSPIDKCVGLWPLSWWRQNVILSSPIYTARQRDCPAKVTAGETFCITERTSWRDIDYLWWQFFLNIFQYFDIKARSVDNKNSSKFVLMQECIPVGCFPPAHWPHLVVSAGRRAYHTPSLRHAHTFPAIHAPCHACPPATHTPPPPCTTPCEQKDRRLWKYYLAATSLRAVTSWRPPPFRWGCHIIKPVAVSSLPPAKEITGR